MIGFEASAPQSLVLQPRFATKTDMRNSRRDELLLSLREISPKEHSFLMKIRKDRVDLRAKQGISDIYKDFIKKTTSHQYLQQPPYTNLAGVVQDRKRGEIFRKDNRSGIKLLDDIAVSRGAMQCEGTSFVDVNQIERQIKEIKRTSRSHSKKNHFVMVCFPVIEESSESTSMVSRTPSPLRNKERSKSSKAHYKLLNLSLKPNEMSHEQYESNGKNGKAMHMYLSNNFINEISPTSSPSAKEKYENIHKLKPNSHRYLAGYLMQKPQGAKNLKKLIISSPFNSSSQKFKS